MIPLMSAVLAVLFAAATAVLAAYGRRQRTARTTAAERGERLAAELDALRTEHETLQRTAVTDPLTGVWNYRYLQLALDREISRSVRGRSRLALLLLDLDGFAGVNREFGHQRGNALLRDLAQRLDLEIRQSDTLGRYGGEEFLVLLPETDADGAAHVAERLCWTVRRHPLDTAADGAPARRGGLTASIGIAVLPDNGCHAATLLRAADAALAEAKAAGGDGWRDVLPDSLKEPADTPSDDSARTPDDTPARLPAPAAEERNRRAGDRRG